MSESSPNDRVTRARALHTPGDAIALYRDWAAEYDQDIFDVMGFTGTDRIADLLVEHLAEHPSGSAAAVVDLGCGTGAAGVRLADHGVATIDGLDISPEMLAIARERGCYRRLVEVDLTDPTFAAELVQCYDASVSAGTFTDGHVGASAVPAIVQLLRPGAVVAWVVAEARWPEMAAAMSTVGFSTLQAELEPIRRDGPPAARMVVATLG